MMQKRQETEVTGVAKCRELLERVNGGSG